jgi:hypothetical protein
MNQLAINLEKMHEILDQDKDNKFGVWKDLIGIYESTLGGCNCSKQSRIDAANAYFKASILRDKNSNLPLFDILKAHLSVDKIIFKDVDENIFAEV